MLICPRCSKKQDAALRVELLAHKEGYSCSICKVQYPLENKVLYFAKDQSEDNSGFSAGNMDQLEAYEHIHFWHVHRREEISKTLSKYLKTTSNGIELGAGTGSVASLLLDQGITLSVAELHQSGLERLSKKPFNAVYQMNLEQLPFTNHFEWVGLFDVLEHLDQDELALKNIYQMLKPGGHLILTVPAFTHLWSRFDQVSCHRRRYSKDELVLKLKAAGFKVKEVKYFFVLIYPLLLLRALISRAQTSRVEENELSSGLKLNPILNSLLLWLCRFEAQWSGLLKKLSLGGSLIAVAKRDD